EVQEWLRKNLYPTGIYAPLGRWSSPYKQELWIIERITPEGTFYHAILADSTCTISDTATWAYHLIQPDKMEQARGEITQEGKCIVYQETHITHFTNEQPQTTVNRTTRAYTVDWSSGKLRAL
ncbi:MAG: hypothetical protein RMJ66_08125, partial [Bacteroidia bacterium]|nr:hypothetical protein [Bacteroidia bacterium]MDW8135013.1 hypothetical protein [Bacteroidia bacterium]